jgi:phage terminase small subunit
MPVLENAQHELFAQQMAKGASQRDAYRAAGYNTKSDAAADASASRLLSNAKVAARVAELQTKVEALTVEKTAVTKAWVIAKLVENVERAMQAEPVLDNEGKPTGEYKYNGSVANRSLELLGKEQGMFIDRKEVGKPGDFADSDDTELDGIIRDGIKEFPELLQELQTKVSQATGRRATKH